MKAVICGAGIAGLALAQRLDDMGWQVVVLERASRPRGQGYMVDFFGPGFDAAEAMDLLPRLRELSYRVGEASYVDERGRRRAGLDYGRFSRVVGGRLLSIMRPDLERALREGLSDRGDLRYGTGPERIEDTADGVRVTLVDGTVEHADLLVGADGVHSTVRRLVFGEEDRYLRHLGFHTAAFVFDDPGLLREVSGRFCLTDTVGRQMGFYALRDGKVAAFAVHRSADRRLPADARAAVRAEYAGLGWIVPRALEKCPPHEDVYYDHVAQIVMDGWSRGRTVLTGDAAHAVSLLAGQGASLGVAGAYVLAEELGRSASVEEGLAAYERRWRPVAEDRQRAGRAAAEWFLPSSPTRLRVRRMAMRLTAVPGVDRLVARSLSGKPSVLAAQRP
ncbi:FAD-dependent monooxygenase [Streptomyces sp. HNM0663]|uniref:FAD-dependent monooxygenase n=1 Tax=Streptomyces chengmaiensis TaxID=3040919 RepID=A0ABT6HH79_9ACTN|nr:FAD-dependent monooxygenase [Streptomyces chengmaiensis]MDH2387603.1 FAD-dependent monooxygenase [Streptomyces chengmaiensis]